MSENKYYLRFHLRRASDEDKRRGTIEFEEESINLYGGKKKTDHALISVINYEDVDEAINI
jgi:hypothetical protein